MALFFDQAWFEDRLRALSLTRTHVAQVLGLSEEEVGEVWKDQRELRARDVLLLSGLLGVEPKDIATRAGVSTPVPQSPMTVEALAARLEQALRRIDAVEERLRALEGNGVKKI
ncbi:MAG TPA: DNA-binding protein [Alphaproteobacteria bacterium]|nr:DNA-binding protein [Alphaproteobacteria bacterium]HAJ45107.1 DNA-binding protein [Alphaproteobacteria bacterium]